MTAPTRTAAKCSNPGVQPQPLREHERAEQPGHAETVLDRADSLHLERQRIDYGSSKRQQPHRPQVSLIDRR